MENMTPVEAFDQRFNYEERLAASLPQDDRQKDAVHFVESHEVFFHVDVPVPDYRETEENL
jgi:hypothetical protein